MNIDQKLIYNTIIKALNENNANDENNTTKQKVFFVDGPEGTGKTFLFNMLLARTRRSFGIALAVASSGIAALLLTEGKTAHSRFKIPLKITETTTLNISKQSNLADLI